MHNCTFIQCDVRNFTMNVFAEDSCQF